MGYAFLVGGQSRRTRRLFSKGAVRDFRQEPSRQANRSGIKGRVTSCDYQYRNM